MPLGFQHFFLQLRHTFCLEGLSYFDKILFQHPICLLEHLQNKTDEYLEKLLKQNPEEPPEKVEEFGLTRIREIMAGFQSTHPEPRCDCQLPCSRKLFTIQSWRSDAKNKNELETGQKNGYAFFQVIHLFYISGTVVRAMASNCRDRIAPFKKIFNELG